MDEERVREIVREEMETPSLTGPSFRVAETPGCRDVLVACQSLNEGGSATRPPVAWFLKDRTVNGHFRSERQQAS